MGIEVRGSTDGKPFEVFMVIQQKMEYLGKRKSLTTSRSQGNRRCSKMEKTVEIDQTSRFLKDLEMLRGVNFEYDDGFKFGYNNPLEQLGLYMKRDEDEEEKETNGHDGVDVEEEVMN
ncbi:hypothetical protein L6452_16936 [Arctium lappa]|uniref:Uncharacterized protein n=1 Tax=Arctium lappa TaxID=4217 RepID=A0ACB9C203_ARCLA|nr:hypothetical protein L6452_16936 [Arctium lappa]